jgi:hypothetical protein
LCDPLLRAAANDEKKSTFLAGRFIQLSTMINDND